LAGVVLAGLTSIADDGSGAGFVLGLVLVAIGQVIVLVAVIAAGVRLGMRAHDVDTRAG
jgi:hypothetical protein